MNKILVICGPTATGKTALAAMLARKFNGELISADSRQVYRGMDLTTGKDRPDAPIWLYDVVNPDEEFSVSHWVKLASSAVADIHSRKKLPIVVGGTGLYIDALINPPETINIPPDKELRQTLQKKTVQELQKMVKRRSMNDSDWNNPRRLIRAIEIARAGTKTAERAKQYDVLQIGLTAPFPDLYKRIDERKESRIKAGLADEIACLQNYSRELPAMSAIGVNEHAYARRQMTWFRKRTGIRWFDVTRSQTPEEIDSLVRAWYN